MSHFQQFENLTPVQFNGAHRLSDNEEAYRHSIVPFFTPLSFATSPRGESDPTDQLLGRVKAISFGSVDATSLQFFPESSKGEPVAPYGFQHPFRHDSANFSFNQEAFLIQPYPFTPALDHLQRQASPIETISSDSSQLDIYGRYATSSIDSEPESNGSPAMPLFEDFCYFEHHGSQLRLEDNIPFCSLSEIEIQSIPDETQERYARFPQENDFLLQEGPLKEEYCFPTIPMQSSYDELPTIGGKHDLVVNADPLPDYISDDEKDSDYTPNRSKVRRSSRASTKQQVQSLARSKVTKRVAPKTQTIQNAKTKQTFHNAVNPAPDDMDNAAFSNPFSCPLTPYGCKSTFKSKNEWKRHIISRHLYLGFWRCDCCPDSETRPNDFNRKDLFTQHLRRMHHPQKDVPVTSLPKSPPKNKKTNKKSKGRGVDGVPAVDPASEDFENSLDEIRDRCWIRIRGYPTKAFCAFCEEIFEGDGGFETWLEHAGKHLSTLAKRDQGMPQSPNGIANHQVWLKDTVFRDWLIDQGFLKEDSDGQLSLVDDETAHFVNMKQLQAYQLK